MFYGNAEGRVLGPDYGTQALYMSKTLVLSITARLCSFQKVHGSDMMHLHPHCCGNLDCFTDMFAEHDNPCSDPSDVQNKDTQGPVINPTDREMRRWLGGPSTSPTWWVGARSASRHCTNDTAKKLCKNHAD